MKGVVEGCSKITKRIMYSVMVKQFPRYPHFLNVENLNSQSLNRCIRRISEPSRMYGAMFSPIIQVCRATHTSDQPHSRITCLIILCSRHLALNGQKTLVCMCGQCSRKFEICQVGMLTEIAVAVQLTKIHGKPRISCNVF